MKASQETLESKDLVTICNKFVENIVWIVKRNKLFRMYIKCNVIRLRSISSSNLCYLSIDIWEEIHGNNENNDNNISNSKHKSNSSDLPLCSGFVEIEVRVEI